MDVHDAADSPEPLEKEDLTDRLSAPDERDRIVRALTEALERDFDELFEPDRAA